MSGSNPDGCCGVKESCCPDMNVPESLNAVIETECGSYSCELLLRDEAGLKVWGADDVVIEGVIDPFLGCEQLTTDVAFFCGLVGDWECVICSTGRPADNTQCDPLSVTFEFEPLVCSDQGVKVTVTE